MRRFFEICGEIKVVAVEVTVLLGFLGVLALVGSIEWHHVSPLFAR
jgi:hypothetical protein